MSVIMDYIIAGIIFGILSLTIARVQTNLNSSLALNTFTLITQANAVSLAQQIEYDFLKMGYRVKGPIILSADSTGIQFLGGYMNGTMLDTPRITYSRGTVAQASQTSNVNDFPLFRQYNAVTPVQQNWGLTRFVIRYYDSTQTKINSPVPAGSLKNIRSIYVQFTVESPSPVISISDTSTASINWQKLMFPRNLANIIH